MQKLLEGIHQFQTEYFGARKGLFEELAKGQRPQALFVTCSDSRVNPNLLTQTEPGELFILRNAGNIVPPHGVPSGEAATIEYAIQALGITDVIVCGHSHCGAVKGLLEPESLETMPAVRAWLSHAEATARIVKENYADRPPPQRLMTAIEENVLVQIENMRTLPVVASSLARRALRIHAWVYKLETGEVFAYDAKEGQYGTLGTDGRGRPSALPRRTI
jgi:carbonic anhydrase